MRVIVISDDDAPDPAPENSEPLGKEFIASIGVEGEWIQTSYNGNFRKRYACIGSTYDRDADVFIDPQPYPSWELDANHDWQPPIPMPESGDHYWDEANLTWLPVPNS